MAYLIHMTDPTRHRVGAAFQGVSWTTFFFGPFPALFRGHFVGFLVQAVCALCTFGLSNLVFMFVYNGWHYNWMMSKGFHPAALGGQQTVNVAVGMMPVSPGAPALPVPTQPPQG